MYHPYMYLHKQIVNEYHRGYLKKAKLVCSPAPEKKKLVVVVPKNSF
jgi:hypothetical protein